MANDLCLIIIAFIFPPIAVAIKQKGCTADCLINFFLFAAMWLPGVIHAWWIITRDPNWVDPHRPTAQDAYVADPERGGNLNHGQGYGTDSHGVQQSFGVPMQPMANDRQAFGADGRREHDEIESAASPPTYGDATGDRKTGLH